MAGQGYQEIPFQMQYVTDGYIEGGDARQLGPQGLLPRAPFVASPTTYTLFQAEVALLGPFLHGVYLPHPVPTEDSHKVIP